MLGKHSVLQKLLRLCSLGLQVVFPQTTFCPQLGLKSYLERNLYLDMFGENPTLDILTILISRFYVSAVPKWKRQGVGGPTKC